MTKPIRVFLSILLAVSVSAFETPDAQAASADETVTILFTHDLHDNFLPVEVDGSDGKRTVGGYARLASAIQQQREEHPDALLVDAGDFAMGTLFQTIYTSDAPGLRMLGHLGYDVTTLGNHEFDFRAAGLAESLRTALDSGDPLPQIVASNMEFPDAKDGQMPADLQDLQETVHTYGLEDHVVIERNGIRIGFFGLMGNEAAGNAPMSGVSFGDPIERAKAAVSVLKEEEKADLIVAMSHSGTSEDPALSEDELLAKKIPGIDVIISGHSHTVLSKPIITGKTILGSAGQYGENLGVLTVKKQDGGWKLADYELVPVDDSIPDDPEVSEMTDTYKKLVQEKYLSPFGMQFDEVLAASPFDFTPFSQLGREQKEEPIGNLIGDSFIHMVEELEGTDYEPVAAAVVPVGTIRNTFREGDITVSDVFNANSLGIGPDGISGYPLLSIYLTGKELKTVAEVDASITPIMNTVQLYISGLSYMFNPNRLLFNKVTDIRLQDRDGVTEEIDDDKLYRVVGGLYSVQMLPFVNEKSFGLLSVVPKTKDGEPIEDFEDHILYMNGQQEVKEWYAIAEYLKSFDQQEGVPQIPGYYSEEQGRKVVEQDSSLSAVLSQPNGIILSAYAILAAVLAVIVTLAVFIVRRKRRKRLL
ncbi:bifunctional metallophosphatase/5'-nucleotidase [Sporosarcina trichiuri]|uniref:bifunctional metallophosphatase/5'-nucleotidase n=1 Tax=Sporosarcina trichiuri TaxID=3056445 RepID=UPI0025B419EC|nr:bifunctional UDP-sugar hydrolase/5'-nucleotidase [Sporosarcina sp. 0.2-SM1T-5]WJY28078.1 bifunctional UDP-sugar hydrolase/5'-nucleotidase [Sporosarcina sp. 0.2-SM1T-5]